MTDQQKQIDVLVCFGTRPEVIKFSPVIEKLGSSQLSFSTIFTGQHKSLFEDVASLIPTPDIQLNIMRESQSPSDVMRRIMGEIANYFHLFQPRIVLVQGDTTTAAAVALSAFYHNLPVGHIEAGLRTHDLKAPFPEELNRQLISRVSRLNWAPTQKAIANLEDERCKGILFTGNTIVDACLKFNFPIKYSNKVLITLHRRENFGESMKKLFVQIEELAEKNSHLEFIFPMHPNPEVLKNRDLLKTVSIIDPLPYQKLLELLSEVRFVISDSGGIQEECATFKKKVIVCRSSTERPEGVTAGFAKTVGIDIKSAFSWANDFPKWEGQNPYGDGKASERIISSIKNFLEL